MAAATVPPQRVRLIVVGAGNRGSVYASYALDRPDLCTIVGVAEPREFIRNSFAATHGIPPEMAFSTWQEMVAAVPDLRARADGIVIATQDADHRDPAVHFGGAGFHILLEKPMSNKLTECQEIISAVKSGGDGILAVGHVLRYTPFMQSMVGLIKSGAIGDIVNIQHLEPVGHFHFAHSYVRGNWRKESESSFMLLAKACHDVDLLRYMMGRPAVSVSSFGSLKHFRSENKPVGAASRCLDCPSSIEASCPYSAKKIYATRAEAGNFGWPVNVLLNGPPSLEAVNTALREGPYGRCVYECDNDVVDHQVVNLQFEGGATASLSVIAFTKDICKRRIRVFGTLGELDGDGESRIIHHNFLDGSTTTHTAPPPPPTRLGGHGGADYFLMSAWIDAIITGDRSRVLSGPEETLESHLITFAAEEARKTGRVVHLGAGAGGGTGGGKGDGHDLSW